jgi:protein-tyrosine phosphatase
MVTAAAFPEVPVAEAGVETSRVSRVVRWFGVVFASALGLLIVANVCFIGVSLIFQHTVGVTRPAAIEGVKNLGVVDAKVWRGGHPTAEGYRELAAHGVTTVVDLRAEDGIGADHEAAFAAGLTVVHLPVRDGQLPTDEQIHEFLGVVAQAPGTVFLHCGAGVGRTGSMAAAYLAATGQASHLEALARNLAVGPPSLEQMWWAGTNHRPPAPVVALSRFLDAPRRIWASR